jgi:hypothetical protein
MSTNTPIPSPSNFSNTVLHVEEQWQQGRARLEAIPDELRRLSDDLRNLTSPQARKQALADIAELCQEASRLVASAGVHIGQVASLARYMPNGGSAAATTGVAQTVDEGTGAAGASGSGEETGVVPAGVKASDTPANNDAAGTGIVGLSREEIDPADYRSTKRKK